MNIQEIINQIAAGDSAAAKEGIENVLSAKAFDALQGRKQEIATTLFGGQEQEHEEVTDDEEAYAEEVEHDGEQLEERAKWRTSSIAHNTGYRKDGSHGGIENTADTGKQDLLRSRAPLSRYGTPNKSQIKTLKKSITKNLAQMKK
jgi:ribosomal protein L29